MIVKSGRAREEDVQASVVVVIAPGRRASSHSCEWNRHVGKAAWCVSPQLRNLVHTIVAAAQQDVGPTVVIIVAPGHRARFHPRQTGVDVDKSGARVSPYLGHISR